MSCLPRLSRAFCLFGNQKIFWTAVLWIGFCFPGAARAQLVCSDATVPGVFVEYIEENTFITKPNSCNLLPCHKPEHTGTSTMGNKLMVGLKFPGNHQMPNNTHHRFYWFNQATPPEGNCLPPPYGNCNPIAVCGLLGAEILTDVGTATLQVSCPAFAAAAGSKVFSISAYACQTFTGECTQKLDIPNLNVWNSVCRRPPCCETEKPCEACAIGGGTGGGPTGPGKPAAGGGATLRYRAGGAGDPLFPGASLWRSALGRYWSHDYAERIVLDPDASHVWLLTQHATFREFTDADSNGLYEKNQPTDEFRRLRRVASGWELVGLDGKIQSFDVQGRWTRTQDPHGSAKVAFYSGDQLIRVDMPDGRSETFSYHPDGKLAALTEVGVDGVTSRTWSYLWTGDDLARINAPDGRSWSFRYDDPRLPGYMTRMTLIGTDGGERVEGAWEYDAQGNLTRTWKGDPSPGSPGALGLTSYSYNHPYLPWETRVTDPLGRVTTYTVGRDPVSQKPRIESVSGDCPSCGLGPNSQISYDDPAHPILKTREVDGRGTVTLYSYNANGQMTSRTEASGTPTQRTTSWEYGGPFPGLVTAIEQASTSGTGSRRTLFTYNGQGSLLTRTEQGVESGSSYNLITTYTHNTAGKLEEIDPPGYGTQDAARFTYDPARGNLIPTTRIDPIIGATLLGHDAWNRRTAMTDPTGVRTLTFYDDLDRVTEVIQEGAVPEESLVTRYEYNVFGDLVRTVLPQGNLVEYGYDSAGRLISVEKRPDRTTPGERALYTLNSYSHRIREDLQRWNGTSWVTDSFTAYEYSTRCQLDKILHADGSVTEYAYDCNGNPERTWDANHPSNNRSTLATRTYEYDRLNRLTSAIQPWTGGGGNAVSRFEYDVRDHITKVTDPEGNVTRYSYSDRDLLTSQASEISGTTEYRYNEHGELISETDARGVTVLRSIDALDRTLFIDYPEDALDTLFTYDDPLIPFSKGRLIATTRNGEILPYRYDRFGRIIRDGALTYAYDMNGNRREIGYPGGMRAIYTFDFADREEHLALQEPGQSPKTIASEAEYLASGPLTSLVLGNGLTEARTYDLRYFPTGIRVPGKLDWQYTTDHVGNVLVIGDALAPATQRSFTYQDVSYFLTGGNGPWGRLSWTYDKLGNRLSQTRDNVVENYTYARNPAGGNNPLLTTVTPPDPGGVMRFYYDAAGNQTYQTSGEKKLRFTYNAERRLSQVSADAAGQSPTFTRMTYDSRSFLLSSTFSSSNGATPTLRSHATLSSEGRLYHKSSSALPAAFSPRQEPSNQEDGYVLYFAGRPVAVLQTTVLLSPDAESSQTRRLSYITVDHLGTPALTTEENGNVLWSGGFEPFGGDFSQAEDTGLFLRLPGQWSDDTWQNNILSSGLLYNLYRWYSAGTGRYSRPDPLGLSANEMNLFAYSRQSPLTRTDPLGLYTVEYNVTHNAVVDPFPICGSHVACTRAGISLLCPCVCEIGHVFPDPVLKITGQLYYYNGPFGKLKKKPKDPKVVDSQTAIAHEYYAHLDPAVQAVIPLVEALDKKTFGSYEDCQAECAKVRSQVISIFGKKLRETQTNEENSK